MLLRNKFALVLLFTCCHFGFARLVDISLDLQRAQELFSQGKYAESRDVYRNLADKAQSLPNPAPFYYNWSIAEWKTEDKAQAFAAIHMARLLDPDDDEVAANFAWMQNRQEPSARALSPAYQGLAQWFPGNFLGSASLALVAALFFLAASFFAWRLLRWQSGACFLGSVLLALASASALGKERTTLAVAKSNLATRSGPADTYPSLEPISATSLVAVRENKNGFSQVAYRKANQEFVAWVAEQELILLPPRL